ncbi:hypothetical protein GCM10023190_08440 [Enteractinococcus fodinae]|uniref:Mg-chelatase subunit ChlI n=1 Tax=Enteractinococcus fodinae TaxID=684663 RepID=A0ABU2AZ98_9MICC|nr:hypothetical protein [Enteractinococcus fodinae]MDR7346679.1 Mg-chelatase subunit ChlI [Enteractinococcus fodinae]
MGNNAGQLALLAAGYALGKSKTMRTALLVAGGVAFGRMTASRDSDDGSGSLLSGLANSSLANSAREMVVSTASQSLETLNKNLQSRTESMRNQGESDEDSQSEEDTASAEEDQTDEEESSDQESEDTEASEESSSKTQKSGGK